MGPLYCGQFGDLVELHGEVSSFKSIFLRKHTWDIAKIQRCPYFRGVLFRGVPLYLNYKDNVGKIFDQGTSICKETALEY